MLKRCLEALACLMVVFGSLAGFTASETRADETKQSVSVADDPWSEFSAPVVCPEAESAEDCYLRSRQKSDQLIFAAYMSGLFINSDIRAITRGQPRTDEAVAKICDGVNSIGKLAVIASDTTLAAATRLIERKANEKDSRIHLSRDIAGFKKFKQLGLSVVEFCDSRADSDDDWNARVKKLHDTFHEMELASQELHSVAVTAESPAAPVLP
jgi:hypothetical protein